MALPIEECVSFQRHAYTAMSYLATYPFSDSPQYIYTIYKKRQSSPIAYRGKWRVGERPRKIHRRFLEQSIIESIRFNKRRIISGTRLGFKRFLGIYNDILHKHIDMQ